MTRRVRRLTDWVFRQFSGRDYFISYTRRDAPYASRLAARLGELHSVYLDQLDTPRGSEQPPALRRALMRARTTVLGELDVKFGIRGGQDV